MSSASETSPMGQDGSLPTDAPFARFKNERDYMAQYGRSSSVVAAMDWAIAEIERLSSQAENKPLWRHKKRGTVYVEIGRGKLQSSDPTGLGDMQPMVVYQSTTDGAIWVRPDDEFDDGRFEPLVAAQLPSPPKVSDVRQSAEKAGKGEAVAVKTGYLNDRNHTTPKEAPPAPEADALREASSKQSWEQIDSEFSAYVEVVRATAFEECAKIAKQRPATHAERCIADPDAVRENAADRIRAALSSSGRRDAGHYNQDGVTCPTCGRTGNGEG